MDKTDRYKYNTDMNNIIYAGDPVHGEGINAKRRYFEIIYAKSGGTLKGDDVELKYSVPGFFLIPALKKVSYHGGRDDISVIVEQAMFANRDIVFIERKHSGELDWAVEQAAKWHGGDREGKRAVLSALGGLMAAYVSCEAGEKTSPIVESLSQTISKNVSDSSFSLETYIKTLPLNYDYVRKLFLKEKGVTPHEFLLRCRMARAREMMDSGASNRYSFYSVSQIAEASGFSDPFYFSRVFKKYTGLSPSEYMNGK